MTLMIVAAALAAWIYLALFRGGFWRAREFDGEAMPEPGHWASVVAIVPARDEAETIGASLASLAAQDYPGAFRIVLVDDQSGDGTAEIARSVGGPRVDIVRGSERPSGWTGKLWALEQGIVHASEVNAPDFFWFTDADIAHAPDTLRSLAGRAASGKLTMVSLMAELHCGSFAERLLIPAFVFFFQMLYPFAWVNDPKNRLSAAAGGCVLVDRRAFERAGGIESVRREIIDDCALGRRMKAEGPVWLGLTRRSVSLRRYDRLDDIRAMVVRSAYAQLRYSPLLLSATVAGMGLLYAAPPVAAILAEGPARILAIAAWLAMAVLFQPMLRFYRQNPLLGLALPVIGIVYTAFTLESAIQFWRGRGGRWKGRIQAMSKA